LRLKLGARVSYVSITLRWKLAPENAHCLIRFGTTSPSLVVVVTSRPWTRPSLHAAHAHFVRDLVHCPSRWFSHCTGYQCCIPADALCHRAGISTSLASLPPRLTRPAAVSFLGVRLRCDFTPVVRPRSKRAEPIRSQTGSTEDARLSQTHARI